MASTPGLCQHSDADGYQCTAADYVLCPHCQLQLCLKHLNTHQTLLRRDLLVLCDDINHVRATLDQLRFDSTNQQQYLLEQLDRWYHQHLQVISKIYSDKKEEIQTLYLQSQTEFEICKKRKEKQLENHLNTQLKTVLGQRQILFSDFEDIQSKLDLIQRGLNELKRPNMEISFSQSNVEVQIIKRRYIDAAKPLFDDDDENNVWETNQAENEDEQVKSSEEKLPSPCTSMPVSTVTTVRKASLKLIIKRLQHPTIPADSKYRLRSIKGSPVWCTAP